MSKRTSARWLNSTARANAVPLVVFFASNGTPQSRIASTMEIATVVVQRDAVDALAVGEHVVVMQPYVLPASRAYDLSTAACLMSDADLHGRLQASERVRVNRLIRRI